MATRQEILEKIQADNPQKTDPRSKKWEYKIILDALQEMDEPVTCQELHEYIRGKYPCDDGELFHYKQLYDILGKRGILEAIKYNPLNKKYNIIEKYKTNIVRIEYLPLSNYCVMLLAILAIVLVVSIISQRKTLIGYLIPTIGTAVIFTLAQLVGSEFNLENIFKKFKKE